MKMNKTLYLSTALVLHHAHHIQVAVIEGAGQHTISNVVHIEAVVHDADLRTAIAAGKGGQ